MCKKCFSIICYKGHIIEENFVELSLKIAKLWDFKENIDTGNDAFRHNFFRNCLYITLAKALKFYDSKI